MPLDNAASLASPLAQALQASEERYRFLTETIPVQIWTALPNGQLDYVSEQTARSLGTTPAQLLRDGWQHVVHPEDLALALERWLEALRTGEIYEVEFRLKLASGRYAFHLARAVPQRDQHGAILRWFGTNTNIDEQREQRRQQAALFDDVAQQLQDSAAALTELRQKYDSALVQIAQLERTTGSQLDGAAEGDWQAVAYAKLCRLLQTEEANRVMSTTLAQAGLSAITSAEELRKFADALKPAGGLLGATGAQLYLHAVIHGR